MKLELICERCNKDLLPTKHIDYFMLHNYLWKRISVKGENILCWKCAEKRLGRKITGDDLTDAPINLFENPKAYKLLKQAHHDLIEQFRNSNDGDTV